MGDVSYEPLIRDMTWSYSRIKAFDDCPYRWYLKYIRFPGVKGKDMFFADYGKFIHELIAKYYLGNMAKVDLEAEYLKNFRQKVSALAPNQTIFKNYFLNGLSYLRDILEPTNRVLAVEEKVEFEIDGVPFVGYIDLLEEDSDGGILVVDNKSRTLKPRSKRAKPTKSDIELDQYLKQLYLYSIYVKKHYGEYPKALCFNCFRNKTVIKEPFDESAYNAASQWAKDKTDEIAVETDFRPDIEYFKCRYLCEMQEYCEYFALSKG